MHKGLSISVLMTPVTANGHPEMDAFYRLSEKASQSPIRGLFPCTSTGEYVCFSPEENKQLLAETAKANAGRKLLFAGICAPTLMQSLDYMETAKALHYDACVACPPYYYPLSQDEILRYYRELDAAAEGMDIYIYNPPMFTTGIELNTLKRMLELPSLKGIKDSSANLKRIAHTLLLSKDREDFTVCTGTDDILLSALVSGCGGSMTAMACILPELVAGVYDAFEAGDLALATRYQQKMMPLLAQADRLPFPAGYKLLASKTLDCPMGPLLQLCDPEVVSDVDREMDRLLEEE